MNQHYDIVIIGSGMSGLYSAYKIKKMAPSASFIILEKYKKQWLGGRTSNDTFMEAKLSRVPESDERERMFFCMTCSENSVFRHMISQ